MNMNGDFRVNPRLCGQLKLYSKILKYFHKKGRKEINGIFKQSKIVDLKDLALVYCL